jgi:lipopolysaccharide/colanic/teichoic acid biosynthesis glycosyltransferase
MSDLLIQLVEIKEQKPHRLHILVKRTIDIVVTLFALVMLLPLMLIVALAIKLDSSGPVLFVQDRVGVKRLTKHGTVIWALRPFRFYKFRSMRANADPSLHRAYIADCRNGHGVTKSNKAPYKLSNDSRITRIGRILRKTSLDELPQLLNVLKGDMSLVGPRPALSYEVALYDDHHYERFAITPGITGLWQATARSRVSFEEMLRLDIEYVRRWSLWLDVKLICLTVPAVILCRGAA